jgi:hypothetical protein
MPDLGAHAGESDLYFVPADDPETAVQRILELVKTRIPKRFGLNSIRDIQVLSPNRGLQRIGTATLVEARRVASARRALPTAVRTNLLQQPEVRRRLGATPP